MFPASRPHFPKTLREGHAAEGWRLAIAFLGLVIFLISGVQSCSQVRALALATTCDGEVLAAERNVRRYGRGASIPVPYWDVTFHFTDDAGQRFRAREEVPIRMVLRPGEAISVAFYEGQEKHAWIRGTENRLWLWLFGISVVAIIYAVVAIARERNAPPTR